MIWLPGETMRRRISFLVVLLMPLLVTAAETPPPLPADVQGVLGKQCANCHNTKKRKGGLDLSTPAGIAQGNRNGPIITPKKPEESRLWLMVDKGHMPPEMPLPEPDRRTLRRWIEAGAPGIDLKTTVAHWAFRPPVRPPLPIARQRDLVRTPVSRGRR